MGRGGSHRGCPTLRDERVLLDEFTTEDVDAMVIGEDDEHARRFGWYPERSTADSARRAVIEWQRNWADGGNVRAFAVRARVTGAGQLAGGVELRRESQHTAQISYWIFAPHRGRGLARRAITLSVRYAFDRWEIERVEALIEPDNATSIGAAVAAGFVAEKLLPAHTAIGEQHRDMLLLTSHATHT